MKIIAVYGGHKVLDEKNIKYDILLGDFDSSDKTKLKNNNCTIIEIMGVDKTDLHKAIDYSKQHNPKEIIIYNATSNRLDHTEYNKKLLKTEYSLNYRLLLRSSVQTMEYITKSNCPYKINRKIGDVCGWFADNDVTVQTTGLKWNVNETVSAYLHKYNACNELNSTKATISIVEGTGLWMIYTTR